MNYRYIPEIKGTGRRQTPEKWKTGPDPLQRDKYYGYLKHRSQARYREEDYSLTPEEWLSIWTDEAWLNRGRLSDNYCLVMKDRELGWHMDNVELRQRKTWLQESKRGVIGRGR